MTTSSTSAETAADEARRPPSPGWGRRIVSTVLALLLVALCAVLAATVVYPKVKGYVPLTILSGSMEPTYPVGSQVYVDRIDTASQAKDEVDVGSVITFMPRPDDPTLVTHRVVSIAYGTDGLPVYTTRGDANNTPDEGKVGPQQLRGVVRYHVPWVGYVATSLDSGGKRSVGTVLAAALFAYAAWNVVAAARDRRRAQDRDDAH